MRKLLLVVLMMSVAPVADASCATCYWPPYWDSDPYCGMTTYNAYASCRELPDRNGCILEGDCQGPDGDPSRIKYKWACAPNLPAKAEWVVASVKIEHKTEVRRTRS